jgi:hypothetical protein
VGGNMSTSYRLIPMLHSLLCGIAYLQQIVRSSLASRWYSYTVFSAMVEHRSPMFRASGPSLRKWTCGKGVRSSLSRILSSLLFFYVSLTASWSFPPSIWCGSCQPLYMNYSNSFSLTSQKVVYDLFL